MKTDERQSLIDENAALRRAVRLLRAAKATRDRLIADRLQQIAAACLEESRSAGTSEQGESGAEPVCH